MTSEADRMLVNQIRCSRGCGCVVYERFERFDGGYVAFGYACLCVPCIEYFRQQLDTGA